MPKVSVIVPTHNSERYIRQCMTSLMHQTMADIEIICVDNASTDSTPAMLDGYADRDKRVKVIHNCVDIGQGASVNKGLDIAIGEYIAECDSDDYVSFEMYETLYGNADGADVVWGGWYDHTDGMDIRRGIRSDGKSFCPMTDISGKTRFAFLQYQPHILSAIYRKAWLEDTGIRYRENTTYEDLALSFKLRTAAKRFRLIPQALYYYRRDNPESGTATIRDSLSILEQYEEMFRWNKERRLGLDKELKTMRYYSCLWGATRIPGKESEFWEAAGKLFSKDDIDNEFFYSDEDYRAYRRRMC